MSTGHDPAHEAELAALLAGERRLDDPAAQALLARCPECRAAWRSLAPVARDVGLAGLDEAELQSAALALSSAPGSEVVAGTLRARAGAPVTTRAAPSTRRGPWLFVCAAAAAILCFFLARGLLQAPAAPVDDVLLGSRLELVRPLDGVDEYPPFEWTDPDRAAIEYEVRVWDLAAPAGAPPIASSGRIRALRWTPSATELARLPATGIRWSVRGIDAQGGRAGEVEGSAQRSSR